VLIEKGKVLIDRLVETPGKEGLGGEIGIETFGWMARGGLRNGRIDEQTGEWGGYW
jgi:hypothetical protein